MCGRRPIPPPPVSRYPFTPFIVDLSHFVTLHAASVSAENERELCCINSLQWGSYTSRNWPQSRQRSLLTFSKASPKSANSTGIVGRMATLQARNNVACVASWDIARPVSFSHHPRRSHSPAPNTHTGRCSHDERQAV